MTAFRCGNVAADGKKKRYPAFSAGYFFDNYGFVLVNGPLESADIILTEQRKQRFLER